MRGPRYAHAIALDAEHVLSGVDVDLVGAGAYLDPTRVPTLNGVSEIMAPWVIHLGGGLNVVVG